MVEINGGAVCVETPFQRCPNRLGTLLCALTDQECEAAAGSVSY